MRGTVSKRLRREASRLLPEHPVVHYTLTSLDQSGYERKHNNKQIVMGVCQRDVFKELKRRHKHD